MTTLRKAVRTAYSFSTINWITAFFMIAFHALADNPMSEVSDIVTIDSPLGGAPESSVAACVDAGLCVDGPVAGYRIRP